MLPFVETHPSDCTLKIMSFKAGLTCDDSFRVEFKASLP